MIFPVADAHCDFLYGMVNSGYNISLSVSPQVTSLENFEKGHVALQFFACWIDTKLRSGPLHQCISMIDAFQRMLEENKSLVPFTGDFDPASGKTACLLTIEGGEAIEGSLSALRVLYSLGVRAMTLTWNESNELSGAALQRNHRGLTRLGLEVIREMNQIGMAIDLAHLSDAGIDDVLAYSTQPVFASHSNARSVFKAARSLTDDQIRHISRMGGVIGINFYNRQLSNQPVACIDDIVKHILHVVKVGGVDCCAIGSDFDGMPVYPRDLPNASAFPALMEALLREGLSIEEVQKIAYWNLHNYIAQFV